MKVPFRLIAILIMLSLIGVFTYQAYWLTGLYGTMKKEMSNLLMESLQICDYNEMMLRCDSIRQQHKDQLHGTIYVSSDLKQQVRSTFTPDNNEKAPVESQSLLAVEEPFTTTVDKNGSVELLTKYFQRGIHSQLDLFTEINLHTYDSLFNRTLALRGTVHLPHRLEIVNLRNDSTVEQSLSYPPHYVPGPDAIPYYYNYDLHNKMSYRLWTEPLQGFVVHQMRGILCTSAFIILILGASFWYLLHIILRQKSLEEMKEDFTHNITHELKTPIAVAYAANDALLHFGQSDHPEKQQAYRQIVQTQLKQLGGLVEQILSMSMEQRKHFRLHEETIGLLPMLNDLVEQHRLKADKPTTFQLTVAEGLTLRADRTHVYNILSNLIDNAIKYSEGEATITLAAYRQEDLVIQVRDNGIGIPADKLPHLFDKFYRVPNGNRHNVKGYGLGLYYVKTMMEQHRGSVAVESTVGQGSTFSLHFPLA